MATKFSFPLILAIGAAGILLLTVQGDPIVDKVKFILTENILIVLIAVILLLWWRVK